MTPLGDQTGTPGQSRFCPGCGRPLEESDSFCPFCGRPLGMWPYGQAAPMPVYRPPPLQETVKRAGRAVTCIALAALFLLLVVNVIILLWSPTQVLPETADPAHGNTLFLIVPWSDPLVTFYEVTGWTFALYHLFLVFAITGSFVWMAVRSYGTFRKEVALSRPPEGHSPLWVVGTIFFAVLAFNTIYAILLGWLGVEITSPSFETKELWQLLDGYASASVWEELITRVLYIGVPLLIIELAMKKRNRPLWRYFAGGGFEIGGKEMALIWASAGIFGLGHLVYWDLWKIVPTWMAGLAFGYLFLRLGLYACIMLHFTVDYLTIPLDLSGDAVLVTLVLGLLILFWDVLGSVWLLVYTRRMWRFLTGADLKGRARKVPMAVPAAAAAGAPPQQRETGPAQSYGYPPPGGPAYAAPDPHRGFYSCAKCGNTQARLVDGRLECTRCGNRD
ncbi:MAG: CPBP family glutamic-type intramembrane protease [Methanomassiliicoccales archaeon]|nr:CPBP family glutamic-type intramembrane protease [Methanomassiliicoccales archaeon]